MSRALQGNGYCAQRRPPGRAISADGVTSFSSGRDMGVGEAVILGQTHCSLLRSQWPEAQSKTSLMRDTWHIHCGKV